MSSERLLNYLTLRMDLHSLRQRLLAENIANVSTPGYKRKDLNFKEALKTHLQKRCFSGFITHPKHIPIVNCEERVKGVYTDRTHTLRNDGNNVDIDKEMTFLAENTLQYLITSQFSRTTVEMLEYAISEGKR